MIEFFSAIFAPLLCATVQYTPTTRAFVCPAIESYQPQQRMGPVAWYYPDTLRLVRDVDLIGKDGFE